jgi:hypothetical protein
MYIVGRRGYTLAEDKEIFIKRTLFRILWILYPAFTSYGYNLEKRMNVLEQCTVFGRNKRLP